MGSTSIRVSSELLDRLHAVQAAGASLETVVATALELAGGPEAVRTHIEAEDRRQRARARVARMRRMGHRSVIMDPDEQLALVDAIGDWIDLLEERGYRTYDPGRRTLSLAGPALGGSEVDRSGDPTATGIELRRGGRRLV